MLQYLEKFVFEQRMDGLQRLFGAWSGLRWSWILVGIGLAAPFLPAVRRRPGLGATLLITTVLTALIALHTALDLSRSTVLLIPLAPLGWLAASRLWRPAHLAAPSLGLGLLSLSTPAHHVFGRFSLPVDSCLKPSSQLMTAQNNLGTAYSEGKIGARDYAAGRNWFQRAAEGEFPSALKNLALLHQKGLGVPESLDTAVNFYRRAAQLGQAEAQNELGTILHSAEKVPQNLVEAAKWFRQAALQDSVIAQKNLGVVLARGDGAKKDMVEAAYWFRRAGEAGNAEAQRQLGQLYLSGIGVPLDIPVGVHWLTLAARQDDREAMMLLGLLFSGGRRLDRDPTRAYGWFLRARQLGHPDAARLLAELEASMSASELAESRAGSR
jgi:TPR repeat protein